MKKVIITNPQARLEMALIEVSQTGRLMDLEGELLADSPTVEELVAIHECFEHVQHQADITDEDLAVFYVYYDRGADRPFVVEKEDVEIQEVQ